MLLISLGAGGIGLNLTAADHVFLLDPWWNPAVEDQAADRAHRIGQDRPVMVYRLVAQDTVEERVLALQQRKRELAAAALGRRGRRAGDHARGSAGAAGVMECRTASLGVRPVALSRLPCRAASSTLFRLRRWVEIARTRAPAASSK